MSYTIMRQMDFCYGHRLPSYDGKCRFLHGHNGHVEIYVEAETLDEGGMATDFGAIRTTIERWIEEELDHHVLLFCDDPLVQILRDAGQRVVAMETIPTAENIAELIFRQAHTMNLNVTQVSVWETSRNRATYRA